MPKGHGDCPTPQDWHGVVQVAGGLKPKGGGGKARDEATALRYYPPISFLELFVVDEFAPLMQSIGKF
jgi:hypothetical protein